MRGRVVVDPRNVYDPIAMRQGGFSQRIACFLHLRQMTVTLMVRSWL
jgi:hypothetical protein